ncbi:MAG: hypothetical protein GX808_04590 [Syntrophomonadaceae bacterium]|jgi:hypothetical protein|nr:hypothetical protein [Syntrophomonadaceae bacterium]
MKKENEKKGILERLTGGKKANKSSCCGGFRIEEIPEEVTKVKDAKDSVDIKK